MDDDIVPNEHERSRVDLVDEASAGAQLGERSVTQNIGPSRWSQAIATVGTLAAVLAASWRGVTSELAHGTGTSVDPTLALSALTVIGLVWYTHYTRESLRQLRHSYQHLEEEKLSDAKQQRESIAFAISIEARACGEAMSRVRDALGGDGDVSFAVRLIIMTRALRRPELFEKRYLELVVEVLTQTERVRQALTEYRRLHGLAHDAAALETRRENARRGVDDFRKTLLKQLASVDEALLLLASERALLVTSSP